MEIQDTGKRVEFYTGSVRDADDNKPRYELIPTECLHRLAMHYTNGAKKYSDRNWQKGQPIDRIVGSLLRHTYAYLEGKEDEDHLSGVVWNAFALMYHETHIEKGDLPSSLVGEHGILARKKRVSSAHSEVYNIIDEHRYISVAAIAGLLGTSTEAVEAVVKELYEAHKITLHTTLIGVNYYST